MHPCHVGPLSSRLVRAVRAVLLGACIGFQPAFAGTVVVPDDYLTVQSAIDSGADTVQIREGTYSERPTVDRAVVLQGIGLAERPTLNGLDIYNSSFWADPPLLSVSGIDFSGRIDHTTVYYRPRLLQFSFSYCSLAGGFYQVLSTDPYDVVLLTIRNCRLGGASSARVWQVVMEADTVDGDVAWRARDATIEGCWFRGGPGPAIQVTDWPRWGRTARNRIEDYGTGIFVEDGDPYRVEENTIVRCGRGIELVGGMDAVVVGNELRDCGTGIAVGHVNYPSVLTKKHDLWSDGVGDRGARGGFRRGRQRCRRMSWRRSSNRGC